MAQTFTAQLGAFRDKTRQQMRDVLGESVQDVLEEAQRPVAQGGRMPVDTGELRSSLVSELNGSEVGAGAMSYTLAATAMEPGDTARFGWTAAYALRIEYGFVGQDRRCGAGGRDHDRERSGDWHDADRYQPRDC